MAQPWVAPEAWPAPAPTYVKVPQASYYKVAAPVVKVSAPQVTKRKKNNLRLISHGQVERRIDRRKFFVFPASNNRKTLLESIHIHVSFSSIFSSITFTIRLANIIATYQQCFISPRQRPISFSRIQFQNQSFLYYHYFLSSSYILTVRRLMCVLFRFESLPHHR